MMKEFSYDTANKLYYYEFVNKVPISIISNFKENSTLSCIDAVYTNYSKEAENNKEWYKLLSRIYFVHYVITSNGIITTINNSQVGFHMIYVDYNLD